MRAVRGVPLWMLLAAALLPVALFTVELGTPSLWDPDEGRHAEIAREMLDAGSWLQPTLDFEPYREKLPFSYWAFSASLSMFAGADEVAARLPGAVLGILGVWTVVAWGWRHLRPLSGTLAAIVLATAGGYVGAGRLVLVDSLYAVLLAFALFAMAEPLLRPDRRVPVAFYVTLALATLARGPIALVMAGAVAVSFVTIVRDPKRLWRLRPGIGLPLLALLLAPPLSRIAVRDPGYLPELVWQHNVLRFFFGDGDESLLFYLWLTPVLLLPWGALVPWAIRDALRPGRERSPEARFYLLAWLGTVLVFFSVSATKHPSYAIPALFPLALLVGRLLGRLLRLAPAARRLGDPLMVVGGSIFVAAVVALPVAQQVLASEFPAYTTQAVYLVLLVPFAVPGLAAVFFRSRPGVVGWIAATSAALLIGSYRFGAPTVSAYNSMEIPARLIAAGLPHEAGLLTFGTTSHSLSFYARRPVRNLDALDDAVDLLNGDPAVALVSKTRHVPEIRAALRRPVYYWWEGDSKKLLLVNRPPPAGADPRILLPLAYSVAGDAAPSEAPFPASSDAKDAAPQRPAAPG